MTVLDDENLYDMAYSSTETLSLAEIKEEIDRGRPMVARLTNFTVDGQPADDMFAVINGYSEDGVHFLLHTYSANGAAHVTPIGGAVPYSEFADMTQPYSYNAGSTQVESTWTWSGVMKDMWGLPDPGSSSGEPDHTPETVASAINEDAEAYFRMTLLALDEWEVPFYCPVVNPENIDEGLIDQLDAFWTMNALTQFVMAVDMSPISRSTDAAAIADHMNTALETGVNLVFPGDPAPIGFAAANRSALWSVAHLDGACSYL